MDSFKVINVNVKIKRFEELLSGIYEGIKYWIFKMVSTLKLSFCHPGVSLFKYVCISGSLIVLVPPNDYPLFLDFNSKD